MFQHPNEGHQQSNHGFPPNIDPQLFAWLAAAIGSACVGDYNSNEQNSFGNWLILVGQFILTTAAQQQLINGRNRVHSSGETWGNVEPNPKSNQEQINFLIDAVNSLRQELENVKNKL